MTMVRWIGAVVGVGLVAGAVMAALPVVASDNPVAPTATTGATGTWLSVTEIAQRLEGMGYRVLEIERERNAYEVEVLDANGFELEAYVDPVTGELFQRDERKDR
jgi:hypothetical protein